MEPYIPALVMLGIFAVSAALDPRKLRTGVYLLTGLVWLGMALLARTVIQLTVWIPGVQIEGWVALGLALIVAVSVIALAVMLVLNGLTVVRKEGRSLSHLLSLLLGVAILGYVVLGFASLLLQFNTLLVVLFLAVLPISWCGYGLIAYLLWSSIYGRLTKRFGRKVDAVIVLGAGVAGGRVCPLLAARLERGMQWAKRPALTRDKALLVLSGGQGSDEPAPEAEVMAQWVLDQGAEPDVLVLESMSTTTRENLVFSARLLAQRGPVRRVAVVTNSFHAFRAALLMRSIGLPGYSVGATTARYYWPSAMLREYVAVMRDNRWINVTGLGLSLLPLLLAMVSWLTN